MSTIDLKGMQPGDLVEYQRLSHTLTACGIFLGWHPTDDGQVRLIVRNQPLGMDILVDPRHVTLITRQSETPP
jgi:hypothetical protein